MKKLTILIPAISLCLFFATPDAQAQYYYGVGSTSVKETYEDYVGDSIKLFKQTTARSGGFYYDPTGEYCWLEIDLDDGSYICIVDAALVNTDKWPRPKDKKYKETYQVIGYGYKYDEATDTVNLVIMNATGTLTEDSNGNLITLGISGTLSGGNSWQGQKNDSGQDYIWTANFKSTLSLSE